MSVCSGIQAAFRISQKYWKGYPDPEKMVKTHKKIQKTCEEFDKNMDKNGENSGIKSKFHNSG